VSYILDALKKAAEQRSGPPVEVRRLLSPAPVPATSPLRSVTIAALGGGVIAIAAALWMWIPAHEVSAPKTQPVASVGAASSPTATPPAAAADARPGPAEPRVPAEPRGPAETKSRGTPVPIESSTESARRTASDARGGLTKARAAETKPTPPPAAAPAPILPAPAPVTAAPAPPAIAALPPTAASPAPQSEVGKLRVEVIVYSEERPLRWAFIGGRRYVEGDAIGNGGRIEEIQSNAVVLIEDGRRITLRP
jgi:hypothetical protein